MIKNLRQYRIAVKQLRSYNWLRQRISRRPTSPLDLRSRSEDLARVDELSGRLQSEIDEFETLCKSTTEISDIDRIAELPSQLIRARIAVGWTQQELAAKCGVRREKILRYEKDDYRLATMETVIKVSTVLSSGLLEKAEGLRRFEEWLQERRAQRAQETQQAAGNSAAQLARGDFGLAE